MLPDSLRFSPSSSLSYSPQLPTARSPLTGGGEPHTTGGERQQSQCQRREPRVGLWHLTTVQAMPPCIMPFQVGHSEPAAGTQPWTLGQCSSPIRPPSPRALICKAYLLGHEPRVRKRSRKDGVPKGSRPLTPYRELNGPFQALSSPRQVPEPQEEKVCP